MGYPPLMTAEELALLRPGQVYVVNPSTSERKVIESAGPPKPHAHYFKPCPYSEIDVYRVIELFHVHCPVRQHVLKKVLCAGERGHKDLRKDWQDIYDSARRKLDMLDEDRVLCSELK